MVVLRGNRGVNLERAEAEAVKAHPKTQRAQGVYTDDGEHRWSDRDKTAQRNEVPVLVVPEAAVKGCRHTNIFDPDNKRYINLSVCVDCGAVCNPDTQRWQRPRILRASRVK